jgi:hypothetical protein
MPIYEVRCRTTLTTATVAAALCALRASTTEPTYILEIHLFGITAPTTSGGIGICRSTALGTGTLTSVTPVARRPAYGAPGAVLVTNWATAAPTNGGIGTVFRSWTQSAAIGNGVIWTFDQEPLEVPLGNTATGELCIVNTLGTAPGTLDVTVVIVE